MYFSFIRPILEYSSVVWSNCTDGDCDKLEKIQIEAARIVTGATKLCSIDKLYRETRWDTLLTRRNRQKLILYYKMINGLVPQYLIDLVPRQTHENSRYQLRNSENYSQPRTRTQLYYNSFIPSTVRLWNALDNETRSSPSLSVFKRRLTRNSQTTPSFYHTGSRQEQILHTRLRLDCSSLNFDLHRKNIIDSPLCTCGEAETADHFLLKCNRYTEARRNFFQDLDPNITSNELLFGYPSASEEENANVFAKAQAFIISSRRFASLSANAT